MTDAPNPRARLADAPVHHPVRGSHLPSPQTSPQPHNTPPRLNSYAPTHLKACCVVAARLAERLHAVLVRAMPYVVCDTDGTPVDPATAKQLIAEHWTVPREVRARRRSRKTTPPRILLATRITQQPPA